MKRLQKGIFLVFLSFSQFLLPDLFAQDNSSQSSPKIENKAFERTVSTMIKHSVPLISVDDLAVNIDKYVLLDAREKGEYHVSHIEKARYIGYDNWDVAAVENIDKNQPIVIYCSIGVRSEKIGEKLLDMGFTNVQNLYGSIFEWANKGYPLVDNSGYPTMKVHGYSWLWGRWMINEDYEKVY